MTMVELRGTAYISVVSINYILDFPVLSPCMKPVVGFNSFLFYYRLPESPFG